MIIVLIIMINIITFMVFFIKSNERSKDSYIGLADFFLFFFQEKVLKYWLQLGIYALFKFSWNLSAENDVKSISQIFTNSVSKVEFNF